MKKIFPVLIFLLATILPLSADEFYFRLKISGPGEIDQLTRVVSIDRVSGDTVYAYANQQQMEQFQKLKYRFKLLSHPGSRFPAKMNLTLRDTVAWDNYPTYQFYIQLMQRFQQIAPQICRLDTFGYSVEGRLLLALKISDNVETEEAEPSILLTSTMHGDETVGYVLLLRLIDYLLSGYAMPTRQNADRIIHLINESEIWINPLFNPDGTYAGGDSTVHGARRMNAHGIDLNRNFPDRLNDPVNSPEGREPETAAMMALEYKHHFTLSANFHGGAQVVSYPWDNGAPSGTYAACPDDRFYIDISQEYANLNPDMLAGGFTNGITNGCEWYVIYGGREDWMYFFQGGREITIELSNIKNPPGETLPEKWENNREALLSYMENLFQGIHGKVVDQMTGDPVAAKIEVIGYPGVPVYSDSQYGNFYRLLLPGSYDLVVQASQFAPDTLTDVQVFPDQLTETSFNLKRISTIAGRSNSLPEEFVLYQNYPNPFNNSTTIPFILPVKSEVNFSVFNLLGNKVVSKKLGGIFPGEHKITWNAGNLPSGIYYYKITSSDLRTNQKFFTDTKKLLLVK